MTSIWKRRCPDSHEGSRGSAAFRVRQLQPLVEPQPSQT